MALPAWVPAERAAEIAEPAAQAAFASMETVGLTLPETVASGPCAVRYLKTSVSPGTDPPLILVHGFDISSLEYRRLLPQLEAAGIEAYAPCIPGWGLTETSNLQAVARAMWRRMSAGRAAGSAINPNGMLVAWKQSENNRIISMVAFVRDLNASCVRRR